MKKRQITLLIIFVLIIGIGIGAVLILQSDSIDADFFNSSTSTLSNGDTNHFEFSATPSDVSPYGLYSSSDITNEARQIVTNHYFQPFGGEREIFLQSSHPDFIEGMMLSNQFLYANENDDTLDVKVWDMTNESSRDIYSIAKIGYSFSVNSLKLSPDGSTAYVVVSYWDEDYESRWQDDDFSLADIRTITNLYSVDMDTEEGGIIYYQEANLESFSIQDTTDSYLILRLYASEADWQELGFYDLNLNKLSVYEENKNGFFNSLLSFDRRYLIYTTGLLSKAGDFDLSTIRLIDMESLVENQLPFLSDYTAGNSAEPESGIVEWTGYMGMGWDTDNSRIYSIRQTSDYNTVNTYDLLEIDLKNQTVKTVQVLAEKSTLLAVYNNSYYIQEPAENEKEVLIKYPEKEVVATYQQYTSPEIVWSAASLNSI